MKYERNADGSLKLDAEGNPIPIVEADPSVELTEEQKAAAAAALAAKNKTPGELDISKLDQQTQDYIKSLRKESGSYRTKAKTSDEALKSVKAALGLKDDLSPEEQAKQLKALNENQAFENAVLQNALEHGIPKDGLDYFKYLLNGAAAKLAEGEELSDEAIAAIALEAKSKAIKPKASSSVNGGKGGTTTPPPGTGDAPTIEAFASMNVTQKSKMFEEQPELYATLWKTALSKGLIK